MNRFPRDRIRWYKVHLDLDSDRHGWEKCIHGNCLCRCWRHLRGAGSAFHPRALGEAKVSQLVHREVLSRMYAYFALENLVITLILHGTTNSLVVFLPDGITGSGLAHHEISKHSLSLLLFCIANSVACKNESCIGCQRLICFTFS